MAKQLKIQVGQHRTLRAHVSPNASLLRVETLRNSEYAVTPAIILVEGTIQGALADSPELALSSEFGKIPEAWNGRPIVVNHPKRNSQFVPAGLPDVWEQEVVGWLFNTRVEDGKLKTELWTNKDWMEDSGYTEIKANVEDSKTMEVSTGLFADVEQVSGTWNGEKYSGIWRNVVPDHLAILENGPGACSIEDGCGTSRLNVQTNKGGCCMSTPDTDKGPSGPGFLARLLNFVSTIKSNATDMSSSDLFAAATAALSTVEKDFYVMAVYDDRVIYEVYDMQMGWKMKQRTMSTSAEGQITIGSSAIEVRPVTDFVPVSVLVNAAEQDAAASVTGAETADGVITATVTTANPAETANAGGATETNNTIPNISAEPAGSIEPVAGNESQISVSTGTEETSAVTTTTVAAAEGPVHTLQALMDKGSKEETSRVQQALEVLEDQRNSLINQIKASESNSFTETELKAMSYKQLQKLVAFATKTDYAGNVGQPEVRGTADVRYNAPVLAFPRKTA